ncbi:sulfatase family protein [Gaoshiqia sediminis]|uniref:Arylsulfatase n=1 Tax=Gaoshiqia sediminis TaxID=2986998 RepID=A0AA41Y9B3_9BACT|nr:arylsulfatase [Gaoshiqia sediminis]MCW0481600.1 arylsulfatase [Gaoshiqia sediminis]
MKNLLLTTTCLATVTACTTAKKEVTPQKPNVLIVYVDDLGFGDVGINGAKGVQTPHVDRLAKNGVNFTDAHCSAATCTPSRYSLLTGSYAFRNQAAVLPGDAPLIIDPNKGTLASMLKDAGYTTGVIGKWHLGLGMGQVNWNEEVKPGPKEIGFDYSFLIPATGDRVPCVFLENQRVVGVDPNDPITVSYSSRVDGLPLGSEHPELLKQQADPQHSNTIINGISRIGYMSGGEKALWKDEDFPFVLTEKAKTFMTENKDNPFFLYFAFHDIHVPRVVNEQFVGQSTMGPRGDAIAQMDWCVGQLVKQLEDLGIAENTLIIFSSDNGPVLDDGYADMAVELVGDHQPAGPFRGAKYSIYEAGTRMPTIVYWPGKVTPKVSSAMLTQVDLYASLAKLAGQEIAPGDAPDSQDHLDAWLGKTETGRESMLEEAYTFALRKGDWKYIKPQTGGTPDWMKNKQVESGLEDVPQLYHLKDDLQESVNLAGNYPELVEEMAAELEKILQ